jgi:hypothetical protein
MQPNKAQEFIPYWMSISPVHRKGEYQNDTLPKMQNPE